jgi:hypothetical protein
LSSIEHIRTLQRNFVADLTAETVRAFLPTDRPACARKRGLDSFHGNCVAAAAMRPLRLSICTVMQRTRGTDHCAVLDVVHRFCPIFKLYSKYESKCDLVMTHLETSFQSDVPAGATTKEALCAYLEEMYLVQTAADASALAQVPPHSHILCGDRYARMPSATAH